MAGLTKKKVPESGPKPTDLRKSAKQRNKWLVWGDWKAGKTSLALSIIEWWKEQGFDPDECSMVFIDCDDGVEPLVEKGQVPDEYLDCIRYYLCQNFQEVEEVTNNELPRLREAKQEYGAEKQWFVVDNMQAVWEWARDHFALMTYGKMETDVAAEKRHERIASGEPNKTTPTFSPKNDYSIINPIHNKWADGIKFSGVSFMWLAPQKSVKEDWFDEDETPELVPSGQKGNPGRVDNIVRVWVREKSTTKGENKNEYYADIQKSRKYSVKKVKAPSYGLLRSIVRGEHPAVKKLENGADKPKKKKAVKKEKA